MFNAVRQLGGAVGVAVLTTAIVSVGPVHLVAGHEVANLIAYRDRLPSRRRPLPVRRYPSP